MTAIQEKELSDIVWAHWYPAIEDHLEKLTGLRPDLKNISEVQKHELAAMLHDLGGESTHDRDTHGAIQEQIPSP